MSNILKVDAVGNYKQIDNSIEYLDPLKAVYTYDYNEANSTLSVWDMSAPLAGGETVTQITLTAKDSGGTATTTVAADSAVLDVSGLSLTAGVRFEYQIETSVGRIVDAPAVIVDITKDWLTRGCSDPNIPALREQTTGGGVVGDAIIYNQSFVALSTWTVAHNTGKGAPASVEIYTLAGARMFAGISNVTANSFDIVFSSSKSGEVFAIFKNS